MIIISTHLLTILSCFAFVFTSALDREFACRRRLSSSSSESSFTKSLLSPPSSPKTNLEISLEPFLIAANWLYDHLQPRTDLFVNVIQNFTVTLYELQANPAGSTTLNLVSYYAGYVVVAVFLLFIAIVWPVMGLFFCCCRCCCGRCCYGQRGDIYSPRNKSRSCRRCGCGFLFFLVLLAVIGACLGCFISAVTFRFSTTSTSSIDAAAEATSSAYNRKGAVKDPSESYIVTERLGASTLDVVDSVRLLGHTYAKILRVHVNDLTESMMAGVQDLVKRLSNYLDNDWLGGANSTLDETRTLQLNVTMLVRDMSQLSTKSNEAKQLVETCVYHAQRLRADISSACSETVSRECSRDLEQNLVVLDIPLALKKTFDGLPRFDERRIRSLEQQRIGNRAEALLNIYARDLDRIQAEAHRIASGSSVRQSIFTTLNSSLGTAADVLQSRMDNVHSQFSGQIISLFCSDDDGEGKTNGDDDLDSEKAKQPLIAKYVRPALDYTFYALMAVASVIGLLVLFIGFSMLACCAGKSYYRRASCFAITSVAIGFLFATVLAAACLVVFLLSAVTRTEVCRPIARRDSQMFRVIDDIVTEALVDGNLDGDGENGVSKNHWPPELIFASSSRTVTTEPWRFSFGSTLASCSKNASLMTALQLRLPQSRLADRLIRSVRSELQEATDNAILKIESRLDGIDEPSNELQRSLRELTSLQVDEWQLPQYPSQEDIIRINSGASLSRLSYFVSREIGAESSLIEAIRAFDTTCQGSLIGEQLPNLVRSASLIESNSKVVSQVARNLSMRVDSIVSKVVGSSAVFRTVLTDAARDLGNYLEVAARKKMADFEDILAKDDSGRCNDAAWKIMAASEVVCRPMGILSVFSLLLLGVCLLTLPLIWCVGAPFAQTLRWPSNPLIPGLNPQMNQIPGFEGLPLLDLLPRYQKIG